MSKKKKLNLGIIQVERIYPNYSNRVLKSYAFQKNLAIRTIHRSNIYHEISKLPNDRDRVNKNLWLGRLLASKYFKEHLNKDKFIKLTEYVLFYKILDSLTYYIEKQKDEINVVHIVKNGIHTEIDKNIPNNSMHESSPMLENLQLSHTNKLQPILNILKKLGAQYTYAQSKERNIDDSPCIVENSIKKEVDLRNLGIKYEQFIANQLIMHGYNAEFTSVVNDFGVDIIVNSNNHKIVIQCKYWDSLVGIEAVQEVFAGMHFYEAQFSIVISNNELTRNAKILAEKLDVKFVKLQMPK